MDIKLNLTVRFENISGTTYQRLLEDVLFNDSFSPIDDVKTNLTVRFKRQGYLSEFTYKRLVNILEFDAYKELYPEFLNIVKVVKDSKPSENDEVVIDNLSLSTYDDLLDALLDHNYLWHNGLVGLVDLGNVEIYAIMCFKDLSESRYKEILDFLWDNDLILLDDFEREEIDDSQNKVVINDDDIRGGVFNEESINLDRDSLMLLINEYGIFNEDEAYKTVDRMFNGEFYSPVIARALADKYYVKELQFIAREICRHEKFNEHLLALIESAIELNEDKY